MDEWTGFLILIISGIMSSFSQVLLKKSALKIQNDKDEKKKDKEAEKSAKEKIMAEYLNGYVISGYVIMGLCMVATMIAFTAVDMKYGAVLESLTYLYIMVLSRLFFGEKMTKMKVLGNLMIVAGVIVFSIGGR